MQKEIKELIDHYENGSIDRREFLSKLIFLAGSITVLNSLLPGLQAKADIISADDPRLDTDQISYAGDGIKMMGYLAKPKKVNKLPAVIVIHENKGLQPHIKDVARRMALEGFLVLAPDALSPIGGTPDDVDTARSKMRELDSDSTKKNFIAAVQYLKTHPNSTGKVGCTGFCWGGGMTNQVAVNAPDLDAAVPYYGRQPAEEDVKKIKASMMMHYAGLDERINSGIPAFEKALKEAGIDYKIYIYDGAHHAFNNDSNPGRYHKEAATLAWKRTIEFFRKKLKAKSEK